MIGKKEVESTTRLTYEEREAIYTKSRAAAVEKALQSEKVRYKSNRNPEKFKRFLEHRLTIWDELKDKTFHGKQMYEKTKSLIDNWN
jgi:hypothetical protein